MHDKGLQSLISKYDKEDSIEIWSNVHYIQTFSNKLEQTCNLEITCKSVKLHIYHDFHSTIISHINEIAPFLFSSL